MGRARNNDVAGTGLWVRDRRQGLFAAALGDTRGARRSGDLAPGTERIRQLGFDVPGLDREAELFADAINRQTAAQRGQVNILEGVPDFTAKDVAPFASIILKNRAACAALPIPKTTIDTEWFTTSLVNLIVNAGTQRPWDMTSEGSFILKNLLWQHAEVLGAAYGAGSPEFSSSAELAAFKGLYERLCEYFQVPAERRSQNLWSSLAGGAVPPVAPPASQP